VGFTVLAALTTCESLPLAEMCAVRVLILGYKNVALTTTSLNSLEALVFKGVCLQRNIYGRFGVLQDRDSTVSRGQRTVLALNLPPKGPAPLRQTPYHSDNHSPSF
jgi:hypothetical protein